MTEGVCRHCGEAVRLLPPMGARGRPKLEVHGSPYVDVCDGTGTRHWDDPTPVCRPRIRSCWYPWPDSPADYSWSCPVHGPRWMEPVKPFNNCQVSFATLAAAVDDATAHVAREAR